MWSEILFHVTYFLSENQTKEQLFNRVHKVYRIGDGSFYLSNTFVYYM